MKKKTQKLLNKDEGFSNLIDSYVYALQGNSDEIAELLGELSTRNLSKADKADLKRIKRELLSLDNQIDKIGK